MQVVQGHFLQAFGIDLFSNFFNFRFTSSRYSANCSLLIQVSSTLVYLKSWRLTNWSWFSPSFYHFLFRTRYYRPVIVTGCRWIYIIFNMLGGLGAKLAMMMLYNLCVLLRNMKIFFNKKCTNLSLLLISPCKSKIYYSSWFKFRSCFSSFVITLKITF